MNVIATTSRPPVVRAGNATVATIAEANAPRAIGSHGNGTKGPSPRVMMLCGRDGHQDDEAQSQRPTAA